MNENKTEPSSSNPVKMLKVENSDVVKRTLVSLINVASTKTSKVYARTTMKALLQKLERNHVLLKYIAIEDAEDIEDNVKAVTVMSKANSIGPEEIGKAIQRLIDIYKKKLGEKAGYFFIREFRDHLGEDYHSIIKKMGVDLRLSELQDELYGWDSEKYKIKDDNDANIAFIEKK